MKNKPYVIGVAYDELTSAIGARVVQDIMACKNVAFSYGRELQVVCQSKQLSDLKKLISSLRVDVLGSNSPKSNICLVYKCGDYYPNAFEANTQVQRNYQQRKKEKNLLLEHDTRGFPLKEDHRVSFSNMTRMYNRPNGYSPPDAAMVMMWGPVKG